MSIEKISIGSQHELEQMITKEMGQIEKDLTMICNNIPINDKATLDVLCHDENGQLVIVQLNVNEDDTMLLHGIQSLDYVDKFKSFLKATYSKHKINDKEKPRLILIAPSFSDAVKRAVESMKGIRVDLYEWEYLKLGDHKGLRLQPVFALRPDEKSKEELQSPAEEKHSSKPKKKELTPEPEPEKKEDEAELLKSETPELPHVEPPEGEDYKPKESESQKKKLRLF